MFQGPGTFCRLFPLTSFATTGCASPDSLVWMSAGWKKLLVPLHVLNWPFPIWSVHFNVLFNNSLTFDFFPPFLFLDGCS